MSIQAITEVNKGKEPSSAESSQPSEIQPLPHLNYISGPRAELFRSLIGRGILDPYGKISPSYASLSLPPLTTKELRQISLKLDQKFKITLFNSETIEITMRWLLTAFFVQSGRHCPELSLSSMCVIGSYVSYLLFSQTEYAQRVFSKLGIELPLFHHQPPDINIRMHVEKKAALTRTDLENLRNLVITQLAHCFGGLENFNTIYSQAFSALCTIETNDILMQLLSLKESSFEWIIEHRLPRNNVFTVDALFLPLEPLFGPQSNTAISPESHQGKPLESFLHYVLGFIDAEKVHTIDSKGWLRYLSWVSRGFCSTHKGLEESLFSKVKEEWINRGIRRFQIEISRWIKKHYPQDPLAIFFFCINSAFHLQGRLSEEQIQELFKVEIAKLDLKSKKLPALLQKLICKDNHSFRQIANILKVATFYAYVRKRALPADIHVEMRTEGFTRPVLHLQSSKHSIQLDLKIVEALEELKSVSPALAELFYAICPPTDKQNALKSEQLVEWGVSLESLTEVGVNLANSESPFLQYVGLVTVFNNSSLSLQKKRQLAERRLLTILGEARDKEGIKREFEEFIGNGAIPPLNSKNFREKWVSTLFEYGRNSEEVAFEVWKTLYPSSFTFTLIKKLAARQPGYALRLFMHAHCDTFPVEALECILECGQIVSRLRPCQEHEQLIDKMEKFLPTLLAHNHYKPRNKGLFSSNLYRYVQRSQSIPLAQLGLKHKHFVAKQKKACRRLVLLSELNTHPTKRDIKEGIQCNLLTIQEQVTFILKLYNTNPGFYDPTLFSILLKYSPSPNVVEIVVRTLERGSIQLSQKKIAEIELFFCKLERNFPSSFTLQRRLFKQSYLHKLKLPASLNRRWHETLQKWCQEKNPPYPLIFNLLNEATRRGIQSTEAAVDVRLAVAEAWKKHPEHVQRSMALMQQLIPFLPDRINRHRFYSLLETHFSHHPKRFHLLDQIALRDPASCHRLVIDTVLRTCFEAILNKNACKELIAWLNQTSFFNTLKQRSALQTLFREVFSRSIKFEWVEPLNTLLHRYAKDFCAVSPEEWENLLNLFEKNKPQYLLNIFRLIEKYHLIDERDPVFFYFYLGVLKTLAESHSNEMIQFSANIKHHRKLTSCSKEPDLVTYAHAYIIGSVNETHCENMIRELYEEAKSLASKVVWDELTSENVNASLDFNFLTFLFKKKCFKEGRERLTTILEKEHSLFYWQHAGSLINLLVKIKKPLLLEEIDSLLKYLTLTTIPFISIPDVVSFLLDHPSPTRYQRASKLLWLALNQSLYSPSPAIWDFIYRTMKGLFQFNKMAEVTKLTATVQMFFPIFRLVAGETFLVQVNELYLSHWAKSFDPKDKSEVYPQIVQMLATLPFLKPCKERTRILHDFPRCIMNFSRCYFKGFRYLTGAFMQTVVIKNAKTRRLEGKLCLELSQCFELKSLLIQLMIKEIKPDHPYIAQLMKITRESITMLMKELMENKAYKSRANAIKALLEAYREATKFENCSRQ